MQRFLLAVGEALKRGDVLTAMTYSEQAVAVGLEEPNLLTLAGQLRTRNGQLDRALIVLTRARELAPASVEALNALGVCYALMGSRTDAVKMFDEALAVSPDTPFLKLHKSQPLEELGQLNAAQALLDEVIAAEPQNVNALCRLANLHARRGAWERARTCAERALQLGPFTSATIALVMVELADRHYERARELIAPLAADSANGPANQSIALGLLGDALDGLDMPPQAFDAYSRARDVLSTAVAAAFKNEESAIARVTRLADYFRSAPIEPWRGGSAGSGRVATHAFLVGFPRSGTTVLEQAMASHPDVRTMEEVDCLGDAVGEFFYAQNGMARFAALGDDELARYRDIYWRRVADAGIAADRAVFVDKMPLNSVHLGLVARLFPQAKILFALRDPRDVILSCFRRRLVMTAHMYELATLRGSASFYDAVMQLAALYKEKLGLAVLDLRHEDMIADFDGETRRVCAFLGIEWRDSMRNFAADARGRDIKTPSAMQVVRGLNKDGVAQWRRFATQMAPVLPLLAPWVERFGYEQ